MKSLWSYRNNRIRTNCLVPLKSFFSRADTLTSTLTCI